MKSAVDIGEVVKACEIEVEVRGYRKFAFRAWIGERVVRLGFWLIGFGGTIFVEQADEPGK